MHVLTEFLVDGKTIIIKHKAVTAGFFWRYISYVNFWGPVTSDTERWCLFTISLKDELIDFSKSVSSGWRMPGLIQQTSPFPSLKIACSVWLFDFQGSLILWSYLGTLRALYIFVGAGNILIEKEFKSVL